MRIGTWNLAGRWSEAHLDLLTGRRCDVWLLTEVSHRLALPGLDVHRSTAEMAGGRAWAAVVASGLTAEPDPHPASAAARVDGMYVCSSILLWRACGAQEPWVGTSHAERTAVAVRDLRAAFAPQEPLVWGGDWNHALDGPELAGSRAGRTAIKETLDDLALQVPTRDLPHRLPEALSIDHVAVPRSWAAVGTRVDATGLSDHDAYVLEVDRVGTAG